MSFVQGRLGFRVRTEIYLRKKESPTKCFVFINVKEWSTISDLAKHIRKIFGIEDEVALYIDDMLLPGCETINILHNDDIIQVKVSSSNAFRDQGDTTLENELLKDNKSSSVEPTTFCSETKKKKRKKRKCTDAMATENEIAECLKEIEKKKEALANEPSHNLDLANNSPEHSSTDCDIQVKKKRKRKHQKRSKNPTNNFENNSFETFDTSNEVTPLKSFNKHVFFSDTETPQSGEPHIEDNGETIKEIRSKLTSLANKPKSEKMFTRNYDNTTSKTPEIAPDNSYSKQNLLDEDGLLSTNVSKVLETPREGDTICFRVLKMNSDYCPVISEEIIGTIINVEENSGKPEDKQVMLDILKGSGEFNTPEGIFSLYNEENEISINGKSLYKKLNWSDIREPFLCILPVLSS